MKYILFASTGLFLILSSQAFAAEDIAVESSLKAVTVYTNRAALTRQAEISLPAGEHTLVFKGLPATLLSDSLRVEGKSGVDVKLGAVSSKIISGDEFVVPREKELNDQLESLQDKRIAIDAEKQALAQEQAFLNSLGEQSAARIQEKIFTLDLKPAQWAAAAQTIRTGIADALKGQAAQNIALRNIDRQISKVQQELGQLRTGQRNSYQVSIPVEASVATKLTINLSYQLPSATWTPLYDARLDIDKGTLELVQYGSVRQQTGEDWEGVQLTLSTAQPQRGAGLPDLQAMWVNLYQNAVSKIRVGASSASQLDPEYQRALEEANSRDASEKARAGLSHMDVPTTGGLMVPVLEEWKRVADQGRMKAATFVPAVIETGGFVGEYKIPGPSTVTSDGTESKLMIGTFETDSKMLVQVKPQISKEAYLVVHAKLKGEAPVLPGTVNLFRDGAFMGQSRLPLLRPGQDSDLAFGIDDQISVKRNVLKDEHSEAGIISADNVQKKLFLTELQNLHDRKVTVMVMETVPVAKDKDISVEIESGETTPGYEEDKGNVKGLLHWEIPLEAKQKTQVKLGWKIAWPKDQGINGL